MTNKHSAGKALTRLVPFIERTARCCDAQTQLRAAELLLQIHLVQEDAPPMDDLDDLALEVGVDEPSNESTGAS